MQMLTSALIVNKLVKEASRDLTSNRRQRRIPFFRPTTISIRSQQHQCATGFSRDISSTGIGLLHRFRLDDSCTSVSIPTAMGGRTDISVEIAWCEPCGQGWYLSGAQYCGLRMQQSLSLLLATAMENTNGRFKQRYPFFRSVTVETRSLSTKIYAFSRDICPCGIGLLHSVPLEPGVICLHVQGQNEEVLEMSVDITWCRPCADGWFLSGGRFRKLQLEALPTLRY